MHSHLEELVAQVRLAVRCRASAATMHAPCCIWRGAAAPFATSTLSTQRTKRRLQQRADYTHTGFQQLAARHLAFLRAACGTWP